MKLDPAALGRRFGDLRLLWLLAAWWLVSVALAFNRGVSLLWGMAWLLVAAIALGWLLPRLQLRGVAVRRQVPTEAVVGVASPIRYDIDGGRRPRYGVELFDRLGDGGALVLASYLARLRGHQVLSLNWMPVVRGRHRFGGLEIASGFPLGLARRRLALDAEAQETLVYPAAVNLRRLPIEGGAEAQTEHASARVRAGRDDYLGARPYRSGDEPRSVHWRASARSRELVVREHDRTQERQLWLFLELALGEHRLTGPDGSFEMMFRIAHSALLRAYADGVATGLVYRERGRMTVIPPALDRVTLTRIRDALALAEGDPGLPLEEWMVREQQQLPRAGTWLLFAASSERRRRLGQLCRASASQALIVEFDQDSFLADTPARLREPAGARFVDGAWLAHAHRGMALERLF